VLTRGQRIQHHLPVPVIGRRDHHRIHVFVRDHRVVIAGGLDLAAGDLLGVQQVAVIDVRRDHRADAGDLLEILQQVRATDADADKSEPDVIIGAGSLHLKASVDDLIHDRGGAGVTQESSSGRLHGLSILM
jgi:hypothetical protein